MGGVRIERDPTESDPALFLNSRDFSIVFSVHFSSIHTKREVINSEGEPKRKKLGVALLVRKSAGGFSSCPIAVLIEDPFGDLTRLSQTINGIRDSPT